MNNKLNIKLNELNASELDRNEKQKIRGGALELDCCGCGCCFEDEGGGSSTFDNQDANFNNHKTSELGGDCFMKVCANLDGSIADTCNIQ